MAGDQAKRLPPALQRHGKWFWIGQGLCVVGTPLVCVTAARVGWSPNFYYALTVAILGTLSTIAILFYLNARDVARARRLGGEVCTMCLYDLTASPAAGQCPECGIDYTKADVVRQWRRAGRASKQQSLNDTLDGKNAG